MTELWTSIKGFEDRYAVSTHGRVKSLSRRVPHPKGGTRLLSERILKIHPTPKGYLSAALYVDGTKRRNMNVQRLVAEAFILNPHNFPEVDHDDRDKTNNKVENLKWVTRLDNVVKGEDHPAHILTAEQIDYIRYQLSWGATQSDLAGFFGVSQGTISKIKRGKIWKGV